MKGARIKPARPPLQHILSRKLVKKGKRLNPEQVEAEPLEKRVCSRRVYTKVKRAADLVTVVLASPATLLTVAVCALLIAIFMGRPVFFVQNRVGRNGRIFRMIKLRTMQAYSA